MQDRTQHLHLPPRYKDHAVTMHIPFDIANLNTINISTPDYHIWQHFDSNGTIAHMQQLVDMPEVPITQLYKHMIGQSEPILPFVINRDTEGPSLIWTFLTYPGTYIGTIGMILGVCVGVGVYYFKRSWFRPATLRHQHYPSVSLQHAIVDDDVEVALIYRGRG